MMNSMVCVIFVFFLGLVSCLIDDSDHLFLTTGLSSVPGGGVFRTINSMKIIKLL